MTSCVLTNTPKTSEKLSLVVSSILVELAVQVRGSAVTEKLTVELSSVSYTHLTLPTILLV